MIKCPACKSIYFYGRFICHSCEGSSICFGKIFEKQQKIYKWNCTTTMLSIELMKRELRTVGNFIEKNSELILNQNKSYEWNCNYAMRIKNIKIPDRISGSIHLYE